MAMIAILLSLTLERLLGALEGLRNYHWFTNWSAWIHRRSSDWPGEVGVLAVLLPPLLAVMLLFYLLDSLWIPFSFVAGVVVLLYCMGPKDLEAEVEAFVAARERDDEESAMWHAASLLGRELPDDSRMLTRKLIENILIEANGRLIAVFFWFALLGPFGALLYRLASLLQRSEAESGGTLAEPAQRLMGLLDWLPARLCAIGYAMSGNFVDAIQGWRESGARWPDPNRNVLVQSGLGALGRTADSSDTEIPPERETARINETISLVRRMVLVLLVFLALLTLGGWAS